MTDLLTRPNPSLGTPIYQQLVEQVWRAVAAGALQAGDRLPAVGPLAQRLIVSPNAVSRAYSTLQLGGVIATCDADGARLAEDCVSRARRSTATAPAADERIRTRDFEEAVHVQQRLLPQECPTVAGLDYAGTSRAALGVGGDYYDFIALLDGRFAVAVGDVCGKGMPAALLMATLRASVRAQVLGRDQDLVALVHRLNDLVYECSATNRYATFFYAEYDAPARSFTYVNAGHLPPVLVRPTAAGPLVERLEGTGPAVGMIPHATFTARRLTLRPGDLVAIVSDGVSDALSLHGAERSSADVVHSIVSRAERSAREIVDGIVRDTDAFASGAPQFDDLTAVALQVL